MLILVIIDIVTDDKNLKYNIEQIFSGKESIIIFRDKINIFGNKYLINFTAKPIKISCKKIVLLAKSFYKNINISAEDICIATSTDKKALELLKGCHSPVITCGFNFSDTLTFSSLNKEVIVSLQRGIETVNGNELEPKEFKTMFTTQNKNNELMINALLLLLELEKNI